METDWLCGITHDGEPCRICPVCDHLMSNPTGNIYTCTYCDYTATDYQLERVYSQIRK